MAPIVVFHHAQGLTPGIQAFADQLSADGHDVAVPDLYDGATFDTLSEGVAHAEQLGFGSVIERGREAADELPSDSVYIGFSLGVLPAQMLAQTRPGATGAVLCHACIPPAEFGGPWPRDLPVQIHAMDNDDLFVSGGDLEAAQEVVNGSGAAEMFLYPGEQHLFTDSSLPAYDPGSADLLHQRVRDFVAGIT